MGSGVVVGYDQMPPGERVLAEAAAEADRRGTPLTLVHARKDTGEDTGEDVAEKDADRLRAEHPDLTVRARVVEASAFLAGATTYADAAAEAPKARRFSGG